MAAIKSSRYPFPVWEALASAMNIGVSEHFHLYPEMLEAKEAVITRGVDRLQRKEMLEIMFDDHSQNPLVLAIALGQADFVLKTKPEGHPFHIYLEGCFCAGTLTCYYRRAKKLPYLKPWKI